jgi:hypothetical protein
MTTHKPRHRKRKSGMGAIKTLIISLGLALIIAFWGMFSQQNDFAALTETDPTGTTATITLLDQTTFRTLAIDLPPMPTLIPPVEVDTTTITEPATVQVTQPQVQTNTTVFLGGSKPHQSGGGSSTSSSPAAVTVTSSS